MAWSEERLLRWLVARHASARAARPGARSARVGTFGSDAAVVRLARGARVVTCTDQTIEGVHYEPGTTARAAGRKAAGRALSDLAASAARPLGVLLAVRAPREMSEAWLRAAIEAVARAAAEHGGELLGGDLACARGGAALTVTALGSLEAGRRPPARDRARPGQLLVTTGPTGGSRLGRHLRVVPRLAEGRWLHAHGATAMMDVSDGLALDLLRLARASGVGIDLERVRVHRDARRLARADRRSALEHALCDGEDHELVATLSAAAWGRARDEAARRYPHIAVVGRVRAGRGLAVRRSPDGPLERWRSVRGAGAARGMGGKGGWVHGG